MRFLHTADWQLGLKLRYLSPERAAQMRLLRFQTIGLIAEEAKRQAVDFVLVAGDVLDDNALGKDALQQTADALRRFGNIPVFLLPGNHDAATEDSGLLRLELPPTARVLATRDPVQVPGGWIFPCPLRQRHEMDDPTGWLPERSREDGIQIALAHGGVIDFTQSFDKETPNLIDASAVIAKGYDYLALGDWHGLFKYGARVWYPGAHEATRFKEANPGHVLIVDIAEPGAEPQVTPVKVAQTDWISLDVEMVDDAMVGELQAKLDAIETRSQTLVELTVTGTVSMEARDALDRLIADYSERLVYLRADTDRLHAQPTDADLSAMAGEGFVAEALRELRAGSNPADADAIRLMYRLQQEVARASA